MLWIAIAIEGNKLRVYCFACSRLGIMRRIPSGCPSIAFSFPVDNDVALMQRLVNWCNRNGVLTQLLVQAFDLIVDDYNKTFGRAVVDGS